MKVVYAPRALRDIDAIPPISKSAAQAAPENVSLAIEYTIHACALNPHAGARTDQPNAYRRPLGKYRYTIFYSAQAASRWRASSMAPG
jgi:plasmid stabilization system protein ParE